MKKRIFSNILTMGLVLILFLSIGSGNFSAGTVYAENDLNNGITIDDEYLIPDTAGYFTYYVVIATNNTGSDIRISADFLAKDKSGSTLAKVNDYSDAVKSGQQFILYGQFKRDVASSAASYEYSYNASATDKCAYNAFIVNTASAEDNLVVTATNSSKAASESVIVRTLFLKNGRAVGFDTVNIASQGVEFYGGSTSSQALGYSVPDYDSYIVTYTIAGPKFEPEDI